MEDLWDVVIFHYATRRIDSIAGERMSRATGFYNAQKRLETVLPRLNSQYGAMIVVSGTYQKGDVLSEDEDR